MKYFLTFSLVGLGDGLSVYGPAWKYNEITQKDVTLFMLTVTESVEVRHFTLSDRLPPGRR